jgi:tetratricopeptide (TPR) repeat protein
MDSTKRTAPVDSDPLTSLRAAMATGQVAVVVGAGISMLRPSNLPSWWGFNVALLEAIKARALEIILPEHASVIQSVSLERGVPVVAFSDIIVSSFAGQGYFPLLRLLESTAPNANHHALAALVNAGAISNIVTPNFDTLIELAFRQQDVPLQVMVRASDYRANEPRGRGTRLHKIHGSVTDAHSLIDTVSQKLRGLSPESRHALTTVFRESHVLFLGFSGADFEFDEDYLPMQANREGGRGFSWIYRRGSQPPAIAQRLSGAGAFIEENLPDIFARLGVDLATIDLAVASGVSAGTIAAEETTAAAKGATASEEAARRLDTALTQWTGEPTVGPWACAAVCLRLLLETRAFAAAKELETALSAAVQTAAKTGRLSFNTGAVLRTLMSSSMRRGDWAGARKWSASELYVHEAMLAPLRAAHAASPGAELEFLKNTGAAFNNIGRAWLSDTSEPDHRTHAKTAFREALTRAQQANDFTLLAVVHLNLANVEPEVLAECLRHLRIARTFAKRAGASRTLLEVVTHEADRLLELSELDLAEVALNDAAALVGHTIDRGLVWTVRLYQAELCARRGQTAAAMVRLKEAATLAGEEAMMQRQTVSHALRLLGHDREHQQALVALARTHLSTQDDEARQLLDAIDLLERGTLPEQPLFLSAIPDEPGEARWRAQLAWVEFLQRPSDVAQLLGLLCKKAHAGASYERTIDLATAMRAAAIRAGNRELEAAAGNYLGAGLEMTGDLTGADAAFTDALRADAGADVALAAILKANRARVLGQLNRHEEAEALFRAAIEAFRQLDDVDNLLTAVVNHARCLAQRGDREQAVALLERERALTARASLPQASERFSALIQQFASQTANHDNRLRVPANPEINLPEWPLPDEYIDALPPGAGSAATIAHAAMAAAEAGDLEAAFRLNTKAREMYEQAGEPLGVSRCWNNRAHFHALRREWPSAIDMARKALALRAGGGDTQGEILTLSNLVWYLHYADRNEEVLTTGASCLALAGRGARSWELAKVRFVMVVAAVAVHRYIDAQALLPAAMDALLGIEHPERDEMLRRLAEMREPLRKMNTPRQDPREIGAAAMRVITQAHGLTKRRDVEGAKDVLVQALQSPDLNAIDQATLRGELANRLAALGQHAEASAEYQRAAALYDGAGHSGMGWHARAIAASAWVETGRWNEAIERMRVVLDDCPVAQVTVNLLTGYAKAHFLMINAGQALSPEALDDLRRRLYAGLEAAGVDAETLGRAALQLTQLEMLDEDRAAARTAARAVLERARVWLIKSNSPHLDTASKLDAAIDQA